jgi:DUF4097 and DUF4098 domain-containing protein YvlB
MNRRYGTMKTTMKRMTTKSTRTTRTTRTGTPPGRSLPGAALLGLALLAVAATAEAQDIRTIQELRPLAAGGTLEIEVVAHGIRVERWNRAEVEVSGSYDASFERMTVEGDASRVRFRISTEGSGDMRRGAAAREALRIRVPEGATVRAGTVSGAVRIEGGSGDLEAQTVNGAVEASGSFGNVRLSAVNGGIRFSGSARDLRAEVVSGEVRIEARARRVDARSVSGNVRVTVSEAVEEVGMGSVSGNLTFRGSLAPGANVNAEAHSGDVVLELGGSLDARYRLGTFSGRLTAELPGRQNEERERSRFTPDETLTFSIGTGNGRVEARAFSGAVTVRPLR